MKATTITRQKFQHAIQSLAFLLMLLGFCLLAGAQKPEPSSPNIQMNIYLKNTSSDITTLCHGNILYENAIKSNKETSQANPSSSTQSGCSLADNEKNLEMKHVNSTNNTLNVQVLCNVASVVTVQLLTQSGQKVFEQTGMFNVGDNVLPIPLNKINDGDYFIRINKSSEDIIEKVSIKK